MTADDAGFDDPAYVKQMGVQVEGLVSRSAFAESQNTLGSSLVIRMRGGEYVSVWPKAKATDDIVLPYKGWAQQDFNPVREEQ